MLYDSFVMDWTLQYLYWENFPKFMNISVISQPKFKPLHAMDSPILALE